jgi:hypothetical protein
LQAKRKSRKANPQEEQLRLLRQTLAELQKLNANLSAGSAGRHPEMEPGVPSDNGSSDDEELEEYE